MKQTRDHCILPQQPALTIAERCQNVSPAPKSAGTGQLTGVKLDIATVGVPQVKYGLTSHNGGTYHEGNDTQK